MSRDGAKETREGFDACAPLLNSFQLLCRCRPRCCSPLESFHFLSQSQYGLEVWRISLSQRMAADSIGPQWAWANSPPEGKVFCSACPTATIAASMRWPVSAPCGDARTDVWIKVGVSEVSPRTWNTPSMAGNTYAARSTSTKQAKFCRWWEDPALGWWARTGIERQQIGTGPRCGWRWEDEWKVNLHLCWSRCSTWRRWADVLEAGGGQGISEGRKIIKKTDNAEKLEVRLLDKCSTLNVSQLLYPVIPVDVWPIGRVGKARC